MPTSRQNALWATAAVAMLMPTTASAAYTLPLTSSNLSEFQAQSWGPAPYGLGITAAQADATSGAKGEHAKLVVFEGPVDFRHETLVGNTANLTFETPDGETTRTSEHALGTIGVLSGVLNNGKGVKGILAGGNVVLNAPESGGGTWSDWIDIQTAKLSAGDVMLFEAQGYDNLPMEENPATYAAIRRATDRGIIVVEPAGNGVEGKENLDGNPGFPVRPDSGAIIVGMGMPKPQPGCGNESLDVANRRAGAVYGARVNVQGPGWCNASAANNNSATIGSDLAAYGIQFSGTSGASAMVAGVTTALSSAYEKAKSEPLTPEGARNALVQTGTKQVPDAGQSTVTKPIGPLPNLVSAIAFLKKAPNTTITTQPAGGHSNTTTPSFVFQKTIPAGASPYTSVTRYECRFTRSGDPKPAFANCGSSGSYTPSSALRAGQYVLEVRAVSTATVNGELKTNFDPTPARSNTFTIRAGAGTASVSGGILTVNAASTTVHDNDDVLIGTVGSNYLVRNTAALVAGAGCTQTNDYIATCASGGITKVVVTTQGGDDRIDVDVPVDTLLGGGIGDDVIRGVGAGRDTISGGPGTDTVSYENVTADRRVSLDTTANDGPFVGAGTADFVGGDVESAIGGNGNDVLKGNDEVLGVSHQTGAAEPSGRLVGGNGNDAITTGLGTRLVDAGAGNDSIVGKGSGFYGYAYAGTGDDILWWSTGGGTLNGGPGADSLNGGSGGVTLQGGGGDDSLVGGSGTTQYEPGGGNDTLSAGSGTDIAHYESRPDNLLFNIGATAGTISGPWAVGGSDTVVGQLDEYVGGVGADSFLSDVGGAKIKGGPSADFVSFANRAVGISLGKMTADADQQPRLRATERAGSSPATVELTSVEKVNATAFADILSAGNDDASDIHLRDSLTGVVFNGLGGDDALFGGFYNDVLNGGSGIDNVNGRGGVDEVKINDGAAGDEATCTAADGPLLKDTGDFVNGVLNGTCS